MVIYKHEYFLSACVYVLKLTSILTIEFFYLLMNICANVNFSEWTLLFLKMLPKLPAVVTESISSLFAR